jgi:prolyl 4-hydroxylase
MGAMDAAWQEWLTINLSRGCTRESLVEAMVRAGFAAPVARMAVHSARYANESEPANVDHDSDTRAYRYDACPVSTSNRIHAYDRDVTVLLRVAQPQLIAFDNVLCADECAELLERSRPRLKRSTTVNPDNGGEEVIALRTSEGCWFRRCEDAFIERLDRRIAALMNGPIDHGEGLQILHYTAGGEYRPHFDYFPPGQRGSAIHTSRGGQRVATLIVYLNDVAGGGETIFPTADSAPGGRCLFPLHERARATRSADVAWRLARHMRREVDHDKVDARTRGG